MSAANDMVAEIVQEEITEADGNGIKKVFFSDKSAFSRELFKIGGYLCQIYFRSFRGH